MYLSTNARITCMHARSAYTQITKLCYLASISNLKKGEIFNEKLYLVEEKGKNFFINDFYYYPFFFLFPFNVVISNFLKCKF